MSLVGWRLGNVVRLLALFQLLLPAQNPRLVSLCFRLGNHTFLLIEDRKRSVIEDVVGLGLGDLLGHLDRFVEFVHVLVRASQTVEGVGKRGVRGNRRLVLRNRLLMPSVGVEIECGVVMIFSLLAIGHEDSLSASPS